TNSLLISAPEKTMVLLLQLINDMDVPPPFAATVNVFTLKKADATTVANILQRMFLGTTTTGVGGGVPAGGVGAGGLRPSVLTLQGVTPEGTPIIDVRIYVDDRTNSLIIAARPA